MSKLKLTLDYTRIVIYRAACVFTFTCLFLYLFVNMFKTTDGSEKFMFNNTYFTFILVFSLIIGIDSLILKIKAIPKALAVAINYVVAVADFILVMEVWTGISTTPKQILFGAIGFSIVYAIVMGAFALGRFIVKKIENNREYKQQFEDKKKEADH